MALKRIGTFTKKRTIITDKKSGRKNEYCIMRFKFNEFPGEEDCTLDVWADKKHGYVLIQLAETPKVKIGD